MCLDAVKRPAEAKRVTKDMDIKKDKYVKLWKVFCIDENDCLVAQFKKYQFYKGKNTAKGEVITNLYGKKVSSREQYLHENSILLDFIVLLLKEMQRAG